METMRDDEMLRGWVSTKDVENIADGEQGVIDVGVKKTVDESERSVMRAMA